ncbi:hypothetical protein AVEN_220042-1 [Araneus ventricosus]|uniref:Uncharacterized protein n=1 Tax=Araneus ventricosus TaxID=182803 RepID=A0A4Y2CRR0_ARAVE|nr:hypothetical protein AVEN_220042-1 [Araneus ventricosus]
MTWFLGSEISVGVPSCLAFFSSFFAASWPLYPMRALIHPSLMMVNFSKISCDCSAMGLLVSIEAMEWRLDLLSDYILSCWLVLIDQRQASRIARSSASETMLRE